jgi:hypothetical protein
MIGTIDEAKEKAKPASRATGQESKPAVGLLAKSQPKIERAAEAR